jgi:hypothetical protein
VSDDLPEPYRKVVMSCGGVWWQALLLECHGGGAVRVLTLSAGVWPAGTIQLGPLTLPPPLRATMAHFHDFYKLQHPNHKLTPLPRMG